ncbi:MAG: hypothetical protein LQ338_008309, partial [Usnochroma carphineum]
SLYHIPLPVFIDRQINGVALDKPGASAIYDNLTSTQANVGSVLIDTGDRFSIFLSRVARIYASPSSEYSNHAFKSDLETFRKELGLASTGVSELARIYSSFEEEYYQYYRATIDAFDKGQLGNRDQFTICRQHILKPFFGHDANTNLWGPWNERSRKKDEAQAGVEFLERGAQRLQLLNQLLQEIGQRLEHLADSIPEWDEDSTSPRASCLGFCKQSWHLFRRYWRKTLGKTDKSRQRQLSEWFQKHVLEPSRVEGRWSDLLSSVDDSEQKIMVDVKFEWCD